MLIGTTRTSELVPAGSSRLEAHMPGGRFVAQDVTLVDGQTTRVVLVMPSRPASTSRGQ